MTETRTYQPTSIENCLRLWVMAALNAFEDGVVCVYANQGAIVLNRPFVTLQIIHESMTQYPREILTDTEMVDGTFQVDMVEKRQGTVQLQYFGNSCWEYGYAVNRSFRRQDVLAYNTTNGVEILQTATSLLNVPEALATTTEPRCVQDYQYAYALQTTMIKQLTGEGAKVLERVIATGDFDGVSTTIDESWP